MAFPLPHYSASRANVKLYEPIYKNIFVAIITPPPILQTHPYVTIVPEHILSIDIGDALRISPTDVVEQKYQFVTRSFTKSKPSQTHVDIKLTLTLNLDENNANYIYDFFRKWADLIFHRPTGLRTLKVEHVGELYVAIANKKFNVFHQFLFKPILLKSFDETGFNSLDYNSEDLAQFSVTFRADDWIENYIQP